MKREDRSKQSAHAMGIDVGATLIKTARLRDGDDSPTLGTESMDQLDALAAALDSQYPAQLVLTGGGATELVRRLRGAPRTIGEFEAWGRGASGLLKDMGLDPTEPYLLVSIGTGCSALRVEGESVTRVGGTALGGGTLLGLGMALLGTRDYDEICNLALGGDRRNVDLLVGDIGGGDNIALARDLNAASFAKLARNDSEPTTRREDLADALLGLLGENIGLICAGLAATAGVSRVVFGGSALRATPSLVNLLEAITRLHGFEPVLLREGEYAGSLGALALAVEAGKPGGRNPR
ncbi:hypothetical protein MK489_17835 [Myxococcota bacterium]|nr:hypothetical protein [Myxococcota bacterium]